MYMYLSLSLCLSLSLYIYRYICIYIYIYISLSLSLSPSLSLSIYIYIYTYIYIYKASLPPLDHWQENLHNRSSIEAPAAQYDSLTAGFTTVLKKEVRKALQGRLTRAREETLAKNEEFRRAEVQVIVAAAKAGKEAIAKVCPSLPLARVVPDTELKQLADRRQNVMDRFDRAVAAMRCAYMVAEARKELDTKLDEMLRKVRDASAVLKVSIKASLRDAAEAQLNTWDDLQDVGIYI